VPELTWILFLRILDETEEIEATNAKAVGADFRPSLLKPYRWRDWAAPGAIERKRMVESTSNAFYDFVNTKLIPHLKALKHRTFYGREKENLAYPIALANLVLHGIDEPHLWHGNTLTREEIYSGLYQNAPDRFDVILTNPPFGGKEGEDAQTRFAFKSRATEVLFLQDVMESLKPGGRCAIVLPEGILFQTNQDAFVKTKRRLLDTKPSPESWNR
jgi:hypothetical protein